MAAYGALTSLLLSLDDIRDNNLPVCLHSHHLQSLREKVTLLLQTCSNKTTSNDDDPLETRIRDVAFRAEDLLAAAVDPDKIPGLLSWISYSEMRLLRTVVIITTLGSRNVISVLAVIFLSVDYVLDLRRNLTALLNVLIISVAVIWFPILSWGVIPIYIFLLSKLLPPEISLRSKFSWGVAFMLNVILFPIGRWGVIPTISFLTLLAYFHITWFLKFMWFLVLPIRIYVYLLWKLICGVISFAIVVFMSGGILWFSQLRFTLLMKKMVVSYVLGNWVLDKIFKEIQLIAEAAKGGAEDVQIPSSSSSSSRYSRIGDIRKNTVVGMDGDLEMIKTKFAYGSSMLQVVPIVGMGGIGKTTLAMMVYKDNYTHDRFDVRAWATVSENCSFRIVVQDLLNSAKLPKLEEVRDDGCLGDHLYKILYARRYLIVLDDVWDVKVWDDLRRFLPQNDNGSCVLLTTRSSDVAHYVNPCASQHQMQFLQEHESQSLLNIQVFGEKECPEELRRIQDEIAQRYKGLPFALRVIGGLLSKIDRTQDRWRCFADSIKLASSKDNDEYEQMEVLTLSYKHLPLHLRPCFLYMGIFPADCRASVTRLLHLWAAEGFLRPDGSESPEEVGKEYLIELVERNLILVGSKSSQNGIKSCKMHDVLRKLCVREAQKQKFLFVMVDESSASKMSLKLSRRLCIHSRDLKISPNIARVAKIYSLVYICGFTPIEDFDGQFQYRVLRVLDLHTFSV